MSNLHCITQKWLFLVMNRGPSEIYLSLINSSTECSFKLTEEGINYAFNKHQLQNFVISRDCLKICEVLGEGKMWL